MLTTKTIGRLIYIVLAAFMPAWITASSAQAELRVVATIKPIHSLVAGVMRGVGEPYLIVKGSASPHTFALKPSDASALQNAQVIFRVGGSLERFLNAAIKSSNSNANVVAMSELSGVRLLPNRTGKAWGRSKRDHHEHKHESTESVDPHIWLDPHNAIQMVGAIAQTLGVAEPARMFDFARNAASVAARLRELREKTKTTLKSVGNKHFMVFHDAFQYFENAFDVRAIGAISLGGSRAAGARRIKALQRQLARRQVDCVFAEPQFEPRIISTLLEGTTVRRGTLDPIGAGIKAGPNAYFQIIESNANALASCLG